MTSSHGFASPDLNQVRFDGQILRRERYPSAPTPLDFDYCNMALAGEGSGIEGSVTTVPAAYQATYMVSSLPAGDWTGARIVTSPGWGITIDGGVVNSNTADSVTFTYQVVGPYNHASEWDPFFLYNCLAALVEPGEAFYDVEGVSGTARTLYLIPPEGSNPTASLVEMRSARTHPGSATQSTNSAFWFTANVSHIVVEDLTMVVEVEVRKEGEVELLRESFFYFQPSYPTWQGGPEPALDQDGDGMVTLLEYCFGTDPFSSSSTATLVVAPIPNSTGCELRVPLNKNATDLVRWVETSDDLKNWERRLATELPTRILDPDLMGDGSTELIGIELPHLPGSSRLFARMVVELLP